MDTGVTGKATESSGLSLVRDMEAQLRTVEEQIRETEKHLASLMANRQMLIGLLARHRSSNGSNSKGSSTEKTVDSVSSSNDDRLPKNPEWRSVFAILLENPDGLHYRALYEKALARGLKIPGENPLGNLATKLSRSEHLIRIRKGVYKFK